MEAHKTAKRPDIDTETMKTLYQEGLSATQIAAKLGLAKSSVSRRLKAAGISLRNTSDYIGKKRYWRWKGDDYLPAITRKRNQSLHRKWSHSVVERDGHMCQDCGCVGVRLHAHHIVSLRTCIGTDLEYDVKNGVTLCVPCHGKRHAEERKDQRD